MNTILKTVFFAFSALLAVVLSSCSQSMEKYERAYDHSVTIKAYPENYQVVFNGNALGKTPLTLERKFFTDLDLQKAHSYSLRNYVVSNTGCPCIDTKDGRRFFSFLNEKGENMDGKISFIVSEKLGSVLTVVFSSDKSVLKDMNLSEPYTILENK